MSRFVKRAVHILIAASAIVAMPGLALAQTPQPLSAGTDVFGNMPGIVYLLIPLVIAGAIYLSRELGRTEEAAEPERRQGAVSKALAKQKEDALSSTKAGQG